MSHVFCEEYYNLQTDQGWLKGKLMNSRDNQKFAAFQKIPYAKPPVKMLRFEVCKIISNHNLKKKSGNI